MMKRFINKNKLFKNFKKKLELLKSRIYCYKIDRTHLEFRIHPSIKIWSNKSQHLKSKDKQKLRLTVRNYEIRKQSLNKIQSNYDRI